MIHVRFDLIVTASNRNANVEIARHDMPQVPARGDLISIDGDPFYVVNVGWAIAMTDARTYAFVEVVKAGSFDLQIGSVKL